MAAHWFLKKQVVSTSVLVGLGIGRLVATEITGYHGHVTEYGTHWNFFFTLAVIRVRLYLQIFQNIVNFHFQRSALCAHFDELSFLIVVFLLPRPPLFLVKPGLRCPTAAHRRPMLLESRIDRCCSL